MKKTDTISVLRRAADYIEYHGWAQGTYGARQAEKCVVGALLHVTGYGQAFDSYPDIVATLQGFLGGRVTAWNDEPHRTAEEVIKTIRACADSLMDEGAQ